MPNLSRAGSCVEPGCSSPIHARRLCKLHYSRQYRRENPDKMRLYNAGRKTDYSTAKCVRCGEAVPSDRRRYCTDRCQKQGERERYRSKPRALRCHHCEQEFIGRNCGQTGNRYCSNECFVEASRWRSRTRTECALPWRDCLDCGDTYYDRNGTTRCEDCRQRRALRVWYMGWCVRCGDPFTTNQPAQRSCSDLCARRHHNSMRRVRKRDAFVEIVHTKKVYERDDWTCRLCGQPVDRDAEVPEHLAPTLDHIVPLALGGDHSYANVQCAHFICNARKSDTLEGQIHFAA